MQPSASNASPSSAAFSSRRGVLWAALVALLVIAQSLLVVLTIRHETNRSQELADDAAGGAANDLKRAIARSQQHIQPLQWNEAPGPQWQQDAAALLRQHRELLRLERRDATARVESVADSALHPPLFEVIAREQLALETELACAQAQRQASPVYSSSYFVPLRGGLGTEVTDLCMPIQRGAGVVGFDVAIISLATLLEEGLGVEYRHGYELSFVEADGARLARSGDQRGAGVFVSERPIDLPGLRLQLRLDSTSSGPKLIPNLAVALVLGLSLTLACVVVLLGRDVRRRATAESALAEALAFRKAMEDSLVTGLRARDKAGRITYVNPAFCSMVGFSAAELIGQSVPPYWPPELTQEYTRRQAVRLSAAVGEAPSQEGFETTFIRRNGERFAVLIFEAPLLDRVGKHAGWMSAVLDVQVQRQVEELSRQQQDRLAATARLATVGEMASLLSHELNQPLAAISSYASGSLNLLASGTIDAPTAEMLQQAVQRIVEQAERAGKVIKSVHDVVRRREQLRESIRIDVLVDAVLPLIRLQARKSGTRIELELPDRPPRALCDRTMVEQVLLNLTRNGIQAMESHTEAAQRVLTIRAREHARWVTISVADRGPGVAPEVARRLFTPFFTTRSEGMGLGLSLCRTVIEQHGGTLDFQNLAPPLGGAEFRFTLPAAAAEPGCEALADARPETETAAETEASVEAAR
jgi:two-component system, LuxR family, sensor histidine kinase DctS